MSDVSLRKFIMCVALTGLGVPAIAQTLPEGPGKATVVRVCSGCHEAAIVSDKKMSRQEWSDVVDEMREKGANATDQEVEVILDYLTKFFPKDGKKTDSAR
jgi:hypothetical protein